MGLAILGYAAAVLMGLSLGLMGGGGSILTVPILVYLFGMEPVAATGLSLFMVGTTSAAGLLSHHRQGNLQWRTAAIFGLASVASVFVTRHWLMPALPATLLRTNGIELSKGTAILILFAVLMLLSAWRMIGGHRPATAAGGGSAHFMLLLSGLGVGLVTGVLGAGGGFLIVPALVLLAAMPMKQAVGTSLFIITINAYVGFIGDPQVSLAEHWPIVLPLLAFAIAGIIAGARLVGRISNEKLRPAFGWFILAMGVYIIGRELYGATIQG